jgi:hypothetical protein
MSFDKYLENKKIIIFTLDDVLYPKKDYLLQVYYLFAEFMAYSEQIDAKKMIEFMSNEYEERGADGIYARTAKQFGIAEKYERNFNLLHENARLPLKLLLYKELLSLMQEIVVDRKQLLLLLEGNPAEELNKIKQIEWNGLEQYLKVHFVVEYGNSSKSFIEELIEEQGVDLKEITMVTAPNQIKEKSVNLGIDCFPVTEIL